MSEEKNNDQSVVEETGKNKGKPTSAKASAGKRKISKAIIIINLAALIIIASIAVYFLFIKKNNTQGLKGQAGRDFNIEDICKNYKDGGQDSGSNNFDPSRFGNRQGLQGTPDNGNNSNNSNFNSDEFRQNMQARQDLINNICADGQVTDDEKKRFEDMNKDMPSFGNRQD